VQVSSVEGLTLKIGPIKNQSIEEEK
jgi:hypothetical protein